MITNILNCLYTYKLYNLIKFCDVYKKININIYLLKIEGFFNFWFYICVHIHWCLRRYTAWISVSVTLRLISVAALRLVTIIELGTKLTLFSFRGKYTRVSSFGKPHIIRQNISIQPNTVNHSSRLLDQPIFQRFFFTVFTPSF